MKLMRAKYKKNSVRASNDLKRSIEKAICNPGYEVKEVFILEEGSVMWNKKHHETMTFQIYCGEKAKPTKGG